MLSLPKREIYVCKSMKKNTNQSIFFEKNILLCLKNIKMLGRNIIIKL